MSFDFVAQIEKVLQDRKTELQSEFHDAARKCCARYFHMDSLLPAEIAESIFKGFPAPQYMRLIASFREKKYTTKTLSGFDPLLKQITFAFQDQRIIRLVEEITGIREQHPDPHLYAGGLTLMTRGQFLNPHIDNSHDNDRSRYRTVNLLYYVSPDWKDEYGGHFELWDEKVRQPTTLHSRFNRLVVMETNPLSWHSVSPVTADGTRCCVSNYYFSPHSPTNQPYFHVTSFSARPEQKLRRMFARADNSLRMMIRRLRHDGLARKDLYQPAPEN